MPHGTAVIRVTPEPHVRVWALVLGVMVALAVGAVPLTNLLRGGSLRSAALVGGSFLADVNGDGVDDVVTHAVYIGDRDLHLRAIDGATGRTLWASEPWLKSEQTEVVAAVPGSLAVLVGGGGMLLEPETGKARLRFALPERPSAVCRDGARSFILTEDDQTYTLNLQTGALAATGKLVGADVRPACAPAPNDGWSSHGGATERAL